jgi:hypothetical protein
MKELSNKIYVFLDLGWGKNYDFKVSVKKETYLIFILFLYILMIHSVLQTWVFLIAFLLADYC